MIEGYITIKVVAEKWGITPRRIQILCSKGQIPGTVKFGRDWAIPKDAEKPIDGRIISGKYKNWRQANAMKEQYIHEIGYYKYKDFLFGMIPSMDKVFSVSNQKNLPSGIISESKPIFHESYSRKQRIKRVFVLTSACNLQCSYCFEGTHDAPKVMNPDDVVSGIKNMFAQAQSVGKKLISFSLFGGEPSMSWKAVVQAILTAESLEKETGIRCYKAIVTNGVMRNEQAQYLAEHFDFVYFSFDGPKDLFLQQRKPKAGDHVYDIIFNNAKLVYQYGTYLSFKITVTKLTLNHLKEIDDFFADEFPTCSRLFQPCMMKKNDPLYISFGSFLEEYLELQQYSLFGKNMATSLYKNHPSDRFCNLAVRNVQYPDGSILACHRSNMCIPDDEVKKTFLVGRCENGILYKDEERKKYVESFTVSNIVECNDCSLKYHCCGGCATIKLLSGNGDMFRKADYCDDFKRYAYTTILSRLFEQPFSFIEDLPEKLCVSEHLINECEFNETVADRIITIEE